MSDKIPMPGSLLRARDRALIITIAGVLPEGQIDASQVHSLLDRIGAALRETMPQLVLGLAPVSISEITLVEPPLDHEVQS